MNAWLKNIFLSRSDSTVRPSALPKQLGHVTGSVSQNWFFLKILPILMFGCIFARRLLSYLTSAGLMPSLQSAHRVNHSTETAVLRVLADILLALDRGDFAALVMLNLSTAFDTVNHTTLLRRHSRHCSGLGCVSLGGLSTCGRDQLVLCLQYYSLGSLRVLSRPR